jgi:DNA-binding transcriptional ArsR family regulator
MEKDPFDHVFQALAHPARRRMLDIVKATPGCNVNDVAGAFDMSRIGVMKHLSKLEEAGLIHSEKEGRDRRLYFNVVPIQLIYDRWTHEYSAWWAGRLADIKYAVEAGPQESEDTDD